MNEIQLPPRRALPHEVRGQLRDRVLGTSRRHDGRAALAVAATVVLLAAGGVVVGQSVRSHDDTSPAAQQRVSPLLQLGPPTQDELDRCSAVAKTSNWNTQVSVRPAGRTLLFGDRYCEVTRTSVALSAPQPVPKRLDGVDADVTYLSPNGFIVGTAPTGTQTVTADFGVRGDDNISGKARTVVINGLFAIDVNTYWRTGNPATFEFGDARAAVVKGVTTIETLEGQRGSIHDTFPSGNPDPRAPVNQLARCVDNTLIQGLNEGPGMQIPENLMPGARIGDGGLGSVLVGYNDRGAIGICTVEMKLTEVYPSGPGGMPHVATPSSIPGRPYSVWYLQHRGGQDGFYTIAGTVSPQVARLELITPDGTRARAVVESGTYVLQYPDNLGDQHRLEVFDAAGALLYAGDR